MALNSISQLVLDIKADPDTGSLKRLQELRAELERLTNIDTSRVTRQLSSMMDKAQLLSKTPFLNQKMISEADRAISLLAEQYKGLSSVHGRVQSTMKGVQSSIVATSKTMADNRIEISKTTAEIKLQEGKLKDFKTSLAASQTALFGKKTIADTEKEQNDLKAKIKSANDNISVLRDQKKAQQDADAAYKASLGNAKQNLVDLQVLNKQVTNELGNTGAKLNQFTKGREASSKRLNVLEKERQTLLRQTFAMQQKYIRLPDIQQQYLQIGEKLANINTATAKGQKQFAATKQELSDLNDKMVKHQTMIGAIGRSWEKFKMIFERVRDALVSFVIINAISQVISGFFTSLISSNQALEVLNARLKALIPTTEDVAKVWDELKRLTITTPFKIQDFIEASTLVRAFGVDITSNMSAISDWATATGRDLKDTALAFGKIAAYSPRTSLLLSTRGFSASMFDSYVQKFGDRTQALRHMIEDTFGGTAKAVSLTFEGLMTNLNDLWLFIAQKIGQPLFESLKSDLQTVWRLMQKLEESSGSALTILGGFIEFAVKGGGISLIATSIALVVHGLGNFIKSIRTASAATVTWIKQFAFSAAITAIGYLTYEWFKLADNITRVNELQAEFLKIGPDQYTELINNLTEQNDLLEQQSGFWSLVLANAMDFFKVVTGGLAAMAGKKLSSEDAPDLLSYDKRKEKIANEQKANQALLESFIKLREERKRTQLLESAKVDVLADREMMEKIQEFGLGAQFKQLAGDVKKNLPIVEAALKKIDKYGEKPAALKITGGLAAPQYVKEDNQPIIDGRLYSKEELLNIQAQLKARSILLTGLTQEVDQRKIINELVNDLRNSMLKITPEMAGGQQALANTKELIKDLLDMLGEMGNKSKAKLQELAATIKDIRTELMGEREKFDAFTNDDQFRRMAQMRKLAVELEVKFKGKPLTNKTFEDFFNQNIATEEQVKQITFDIVAAPDLIFDEDKFSKQSIELAKEAADKFKIPQALFLRMIKQESNFNPEALSKAGAVGMGQLMPDTARELGLQVDEIVDQRYDLAKNLDASAKYLKEQFDRFGSWEKALAAYNSGAGAVKKFGGIPPYAETIDYVAKILASIPDESKKGTGIPLLKDLPKTMVHDLQEILKTAKQINEYRQLESEQAEIIRQIDEKRIENVQNLKNGFGDLDRQMEGMRIQFGGGDEYDAFASFIELRKKSVEENDKLQKQIDQKRKEITESRNPIKEIMLENEIIDLQQQKLKNLKDIFAVMQELLSLPSQNFGNAWQKQFMRLNDELRSFRDSLAETLTTGFTGAISESIHELIFQTNFKEIDKQINDLQFQLIEAKNQKAEILGLSTKTTIVEDEEAKILAQINELESERANIILNKFTTVISQVEKKLEDLAATKLVSILIKPLAIDSDLEKQFEVMTNLRNEFEKSISENLANQISSASTKYEEVLAVAGSGADALVSKSMQDLYIARLRLETERQIAAVKMAGEVKASGEYGFGAAEKWLSLFGTLATKLVGVPVNDPSLVVGDPWGGMSPPPATRSTAPIERTVNQHTSTVHNSYPIIFNGPIYGQKDFNKAVDKATREIRHKVAK